LRAFPRRALSEAHSRCGLTSADLEVAGYRNAGDDACTDHRVVIGSTLAMFLGAT
jgi:hypothetical protein